MSVPADLAKSLTLLGEWLPGINLASTGRGEMSLGAHCSVYLADLFPASMFYAIKFIAIQVSLAGHMESLFSRCPQMHPPIAGVASEYSSSAILTPYSSLSHIIRGN